MVLGCEMCKRASELSLVLWHQMRDLHRSAWSFIADGEGANKPARQWGSKLGTLMRIGCQVCFPATGTWSSIPA